MIKVDLITGFLGSGKTTFLLKYARFLMNQGLRIGILEYDYSAINVDMLLLNKLRCDKCEIEMLVAGHDSDCRLRRFKTKLISMAMSGYDRVIIEPSGVFDMDNFFDTLREEPLENWYEIGSVITVANANLEDNLSEEEEFLLASQIVDSGCVVLSRTQLVDESRISATKDHIEEAVKGIKCDRFVPKYVDKNWDELTDDDFRKFANCGYHINDYEKLIAGKDVVFSSVCSLNLPNSLEGLKKKIELMFSSNEYGNVCRVKGVVCDNGPSYLVNATRNEIITQEIGVGQEVIIVIGTNLAEDKIKELIESAIH